MPAWDWNHYYDVNVDEKLYEDYRRFTHLEHKDVAPYEELVKTRGLRWPVVQDASGAWKETRYRFVEGEDPNVARSRYPVLPLADAKRPGANLVLPLRTCGRRAKRRVIVRDSTRASR